MYSLQLTNGTFNKNKDAIQNEGVQKNTPKEYMTRVLFPMPTYFELFLFYVK
jgi:hypothetical protein